MRAAEPVTTGYAVNPADGVRLWYEVYGTERDAATLTVLLVPPYQIVHGRMWKMQVPFLARHYRTVVYDPRGNGRSDRPACNYGIDALVGDAVAVMDVAGIDRCGVMTVSAGSQTCLHLAARCPERVTGLVIIGGYAGGDTGPTPGWDEKKAAMLADYDQYVHDFFADIFVEPHSTKPRDDAWDWAHETNAQTLVETREHGWFWSDARAAASEVRCPVLVIHGTDDRRVDYADGEDLHARLPQSRLVSIDPGGHLPNVRDPVQINLLAREFFGEPQRRRHSWSRALTRQRRALFISSPIGLGHVQRDLAIARELRAIVPDLEIHWWAQHPVTRVLEEAGETIHPLSREMASESAHWEEEAAGHELHAFYAFRRMDEIFLANFMRFIDLVRQEPYDLWIGDESWEIDYYLHENPELKTAPYVFMTDVIGFLPVDPQGDPREAELCADYNAEMIAQRARYPALRDRSLYIGTFDELPDGAFGPGLPCIRDWAREWFEPVGYVTPFVPEAVRDRAALRARLGYSGTGPLLFAAVGGTAVGCDLLHKVAQALPLLRRDVPDARLVMVTGPRIAPASLPEVEGLEKRPYVHDLFEHLACADAAVVQGGLTTTMELVAARRPFVYFPLRNHWEQRHHVAYRLDYYRAGIRMDYRTTSPDDLARVLREALARPVDYREIAPGGARRAAEQIAGLLTSPAQVRGGGRIA